VACTTTIKNSNINNNINAYAAAIIPSLHESLSDLILTTTSKHSNNNATAGASVVVHLGEKLCHLDHKCATMIADFTVHLHLELPNKNTSNEKTSSTSSRSGHD
jgi:hypothetical protein